MNSLSASTTIIATAEEQFVGFSTSQIVYGYSYVPGLVEGAIVIVPSGFIRNPGSLGVPGVKVTSSKLIGLRLKRSLSNTLGVIPVSLLHDDVNLSSSGSIKPIRTSTVPVTTLQFAGFAPISQIS